jgi:hypothetical protein
MKNSIQRHRLKRLGRHFYETSPFIFTFKLMLVSMKEIKVILNYFSLKLGCYRHDIQGNAGLVTFYAC